MTETLELHDTEFVKVGNVSGVWVRPQLPFFLAGFFEHVFHELHKRQWEKAMEDQNMGTAFFQTVKSAQYDMEVTSAKFPWVRLATQCFIYWIRERRPELWRKK